MATITFFLTVAVVGILLKPELYESKTTVIKENDSMQSEVDEKNIESEVSNQEEWGSGDVYDGSSPIIRKMGEKLSVIGIPHRKQGDKPPMSTEVFAYWEGEMVFTVDWALIGKNDDFIAYLDQQLLMDTDERVDSILSSISTASGKEIEIKLPYPLIYMDKEKEIDRNMPYKIAVTKYPSRKYIQFG